MGDWLKVFAWNQVDINDPMSKNAKVWGDNVNSTMDNLFGIKRTNEGWLDFAAMGWLRTVSKE